MTQGLCVNQYTESDTTLGIDNKLKCDFGFSSKMVPPAFAPRFTKSCVQAPRRVPYLDCDEGASVYIGRCEKEIYLLPRPSQRQQSVPSVRKAGQPYVRDCYAGGLTVFLSAPYLAFFSSCPAACCRPIEFVEPLGGGGWSIPWCAAMKGLYTGFSDAWLAPTADCTLYGGAGEFAAIFSTWLEGNNPSLPFTLPVHQSALVSETISMMSPSENERSLGS